MKALIWKSLIWNAEFCWAIFKSQHIKYSTVHMKLWLLVAGFGDNLCIHYFLFRDGMIFWFSSEKMLSNLHMYNFCSRKICKTKNNNDHPIKNVTWSFSCLFDGSLVENDTKSDGNPVIFLANAVEILWLELVQNPCHVPAWKTNETWMNKME